MENITFNVEALAKKISKKEDLLLLEEMKVSKSETLYIFGKLFAGDIHILINDCGGYKAILNPMGKDEVVSLGHLQDNLDCQQFA